MFSGLTLATVGRGHSFNVNRENIFNVLRKSMLLAVLSLISFQGFCCPEQKDKIAEGEYGITSAPKKPENIGKRLDQWTLWMLPSGMFEIEAKHYWIGPVREKGNIQQTFRFTRKMELAGYDLRVSGSKEQLHLSCDLKVESISCAEGTAHADLAVEKAPYSFVPGEFYGLDLPWYTVSLIHNETTASFTTPAYTLENPDPGAQLRIAADVPAQIKYIGQEKITILGKDLKANKYEIPDLHSFVWTSPETGILLAVQGTQQGSSAYQLTKFKSYSAKFMPDLSKRAGPIPSRKVPKSSGGWPIQDLR
jgi:hypothetical protein